MTRPCRRLWEVEAAKDGRLAGKALAAFEEHASACAECGRERVALDAVGERFKRSALPEDEVALRRGRERLLASADGELRRAPPRFRGMLVPVAVASVLLVAGGVLLAQRGETPAREVAPIAAISPSSGAKWTRHLSPEIELVDLADGVLEVSVQRTPTDPRFRLRVPDGEIDDLGTRFRVTVQHGHTSEISVGEGTVVFRRAGAEALRIVAGSSWTWSAPAVHASPLESAQAAVEASPGVAAPVIAKEAPAHPSHLSHAAPARTVQAPSAAPMHVDSPDEDLAYLGIVALAREGRADEARVAAADYLRRFPNGFRRAEVKKFTATRRAEKH